MASEPKIIDIEDAPELVSIVETMREGHGVVVIRERGEEIAVLSPIEPRTAHGEKRVISEEALAAFRSAAGGWKGLVDTDKLLEDIYADRDISDRPPAEL
jgi:hypothetical protein